MFHSKTLLSLTSCILLFAQVWAEEGEREGEFWQRRQHPEDCELQPGDIQVKGEPSIPMAGRYHLLPAQQTELCPGPDILNGALPSVIGNPTRVSFHNTASETVALYWVQPQQKTEIFVGMIGENEVSHHRTYEGHVFHVRSVVSQFLLARFTVGLIVLNNQFNLTCSETEPEQHPFAMLNEQCRSLGETNTRQGFKNNVGCNVNVFFRNSRGEERAIAQMGIEPVPITKEWDEYSWRPSFHFEYTYLDHEFVVRMPDDRFVQEIKIAPFQVVDCSKNRKRSIDFKLSSRSLEENRIANSEEEVEEEMLFDVPWLAQKGVVQLVSQRSCEVAFE